MALTRDHHPPSLTQIPSKKNMWHIPITKPEALQDSKNIRVRRSTGTTDQRVARTRMPKIAEQIYTEFDSLLSRNPLGGLLEPHWSH